MKYKVDKSFKKKQKQNIQFRNLGVIHVYDYFENAQHWILVMERLHNCQDLFDFLEAKDRGRLSEATARKFFQQLVQINLAMLRY
jgi:serine/threonine protein kinase